MKAASIILLCGLSVLLLACASRQPLQPVATVAPSAHDGFLDLQSGWRLRVIIPVLRSGGYMVETKPAGENGGTLTLSSGGDVIGFETAYYAVEPRRGGGIRIKFTSAEMTAEGTARKLVRSRAPLFRVARGQRYVRLLYLTRASVSDHNMAILAAPDSDRVRAQTAQVRIGPDKACQAQSRLACNWVPVGIAVRAERPSLREGIVHWIPVV